MSNGLNQAIAYLISFLSIKYVLFGNLQTFNHWEAPGYVIRVVFQDKYIEVLFNVEYLIKFPKWICSLWLFGQSEL